MENIMNENRQKVFDALDGMGIPYQVIEHRAAFTVEDMDNLIDDSKNEIAKNLFIRDDKKKRFFLIVVQKNKHADFKKIRAQLDTNPLTFSSEELLWRFLGLNKGSVTPFGILNDTENRVEVVFDRDIMSLERVGVHPNDNTATVWISPVNLEEVMKKHGHPVRYIEI